MHNNLAYNPYTNESYYRNLETGEKGECFILGNLYAEYRNAKVMRAVEYGRMLKQQNAEVIYTGSDYRWRGMVLPDFMIKPKDPNERTVLVEVKCKKAFNDSLNLNCHEAKHYLSIAELIDADFELRFICRGDKKIYKITPEILRNPAEKRQNQFKPNSPYFLYRKVDCEVLMEDVPVDIFEVSKKN